MVREHLTMVLGAAQRVDPLGDEPVLLGALAARDLPVGDVAQEHVGEGPLAFALDGGPALTRKESLALEPV